MNENITADIVRNALDYNAETGIVTRRFKTRKSKAGTPVGVVGGYGRIVACLNFDGVWRMFKVHRLAWVHYYGEWPSMDIDHKNGDPADNRISNLRLATDSQNLGNMKRPITNKSGKKGVSWHQIGNKWQSHIKVDGVNFYLGLFDTVEAAHAAYMRKASESRGEFARAE